MAQNKTIASLSVRLGIDQVDFSSGMNKAIKSLDKAGAKMQRFGKNMSLYMTAPILAAGGAMVKTAIDAEETSSKFQTVFRDVNKEAAAAAQNLQENFGLSKQSAEDMLSMTGDLVTGMGMSQDAALDLSQKVNQLAVDLASFTNYQGGAKGAAEALTKALLGEREQAKMLGLVIQENGVAAKLAEKGQEDLTGQALLAAKAYATLEIAMEQSKNAQGDFARTQDSAANQLRQAQEDVKDLAAEYGRELLPVTKELLQSGRDLLKWLNNLSPEVKKNIIIFGGLAAATGPVIGGLGTILKVLPKVAAAVRVVNTALKANPWMLVASLAVAGGVALAKYIKKAKEAKEMQWEFADSIEETNRQLEKQSGFLDGSFDDLDTKSLEELQKILKEIDQSLSSDVRNVELSFDPNQSINADEADQTKQINEALIEQRQRVLELIEAKKKEGGVTVDLVELKEKELEAVRAMPAATMEELAARNLLEAQLLDEIAVLKKYGLEREQAMLQPMTSKLPASVHRSLSIESPDLAPMSEGWNRAISDYKSNVNEVQGLNEQLADSVSSSVVDLLSQFTQLSVAAAMGAGSFRGVFLQMLDSLATVAIRVGVIVVASSKAIQKLRDALINLQPEGALIAGLGLIAVGAAAKTALASSMNNLPSYADGTNWHPGGLALVGERGPELLNLPTGSKVTPNHMLGSALKKEVLVKVTGRTITKGRDLYHVWQLENDFRSRT